MLVVFHVEHTERQLCIIMYYINKLELEFELKTCHEQNIKAADSGKHLVLHILSTTPDKSSTHNRHRQ